MSDIPSQNPSGPTNIEYSLKTPDEQRIAQIKSILNSEQLDKEDLKTMVEKYKGLSKQIKLSILWKPRLTENHLLFYSEVIKDDIHYFQKEVKISNLQYLISNWVNSTGIIFILRKLAISNKGKELLNKNVSFWDKSLILYDFIYDGENNLLEESIDKIKDSFTNWNRNERALLRDIIGSMDNNTKIEKRKYNLDKMDYKSLLSNIYYFQKNKSPDMSSFLNSLPKERRKTIIKEAIKAIENND